MIRSLLSIFRESTNSFEGQKDDENIVLLLRRHPFTIYIRIGFYVLAFLVPIVAGVMFYSYLSVHNWFDTFFFVSSIWYLGLWLAVFHSLTLYTLNTVLITDRRIIDSDQHGLFNRETSELHSNRIQDVSTHTNGMIETFLQFGDVTVQTAASEKQFVFHQVPRPDKVKDVIMQMTASKHTGVKAVVQ
ncbi:MAG: hypothetical protein A2660_01000 [Candidatus Doudnabacteria bacterium RIFCSPHIGHO2_01_FULL_45_18]|uniref:YdbS-like PH domain-containing protein n=1 Tax=Candidatus Doudnabacteria bacterium RIFCSPHIGHO2_01_FULL_45_18 TaxID=1817823 RepID=A0A1F5NSK3_9BACT|nr:MAG: hypothetical protein A2660_01000 [Candidatus Doudnabacteria bacterium RIFCSPHIGHO2_01_FULL_45_18]